MSCPLTMKGGQRMVSLKHWHWIRGIGGCREGVCSSNILTCSQMWVDTAGRLCFGVSRQKHYLHLAPGCSSVFVCRLVLTEHVTECAARKEKKKKGFLCSLLHGGSAAWLKISTGVPWKQKGRELCVHFWNTFQRLRVCAQLRMWLLGLCFMAHDWCVYSGIQAGQLWLGNGKSPTLKLWSRYRLFLAL